MITAEAKPAVSAIVPWLRPARSQRLSRYVGIDIGVDHVNMVALGAEHCDWRRSSQRTQAVRWLGRNRFSLPINPLVAPPKDWVVRVVKTLIDRLPRSVDGERNIAAVSLPIPWLHYQVLPSSEVAAGHRQCDAMFGSSLFQSKSHVAYWPLHAHPTAADEPLVIAAIAESAAYDLAEAIGTVGYRVATILPHGVVLAAAAEAMTGIDPGCCVVLNRNGGLIAMKNQRRGCGLCRMLPAIPNEVLAQSETLGLTLETIRPWLNTIATEITATQRFVLRGQLADADKPILICGDIAAIPDLDALLATLTDTPVARWCYAGKVRPSQQQSLQQQANHPLPLADAEYAVALSLAYAAMETVSGKSR